MATARQARRQKGCATDKSAATSDRLRAVPVKAITPAASVRRQMHSAMDSLAVNLPRLRAHPVTVPSASVPTRGVANVSQAIAMA